MKRLLRTMAAWFLIIGLLPMQAAAAEHLIPGGQIIGLQLQNGAVTVAAFDDQLGEGARAAGLRIGDEISAVNGQQVSCAKEVRQLLERSEGRVSLSVLREGKPRELTLIPQITSDGPRIGVHLKQGISGIGTLTWYDPVTGKFGTLGHGVSDSGGKLLDLTRGEAWQARVVSVKKGLCGEPGLLKGSADAGNICGSLYRNTPQGVFGVSKAGWTGEALPVAAFEEVRTGPAAIRSTVAGSGVREYSVEILKIYAQNRPDGRNFLLKVTDPALLSATGGIVQGMSGSPIIQDGKIVGAVTHVCVNQ